MKFIRSLAVFVFSVTVRPIIMEMRYNAFLKEFNRVIHRTTSEG